MSKPCQVSPREFLRMEALLLGRRRVGQGAGHAAPTAVRDQRIRELAAGGEVARVIALTLGVDRKTVRRVLGRVRSTRP
jgi:hypothetical protein